MKEIWKYVVGYEGRYEVSDYGRVRSCRRLKSIGAQERLKPESFYHQIGGLVLKLIFQGPQDKKYPFVGLYDGTTSRSKMIAVHRLVLYTFVGPCPKGMQCCHNDGDPSNNKVENLRWDTPKNNMKDRDEVHYTLAKGSRSGRAKLTEKDIPKIRKLLATTRSMNSIGKQYNVDVATIRDIKVGRTWKHVE